MAFVPQAQSQRLNLEAQGLASSQEIVRVGARLDQQESGRGAGFEVAFQLWMLANGGHGFGGRWFDERTTVTDADLAADRRFRL